MDVTKDFYVNVSTTIKQHGEKPRVDRNDSEYLPTFRISIGIGLSVHMSLDALDTLIFEATVARDEYLRERSGVLSGEWDNLPVAGV